MKVLGFVGFFGAGKGTAIQLIQELTGAAAFSTSDEITEECIRRGLGTDRPTKQEVANDIRKKFGPGEPARRVVEKMKALPKETKLALVDSLRTQGEIDVLREAFGKDFELIFVEAGVKVRYERIKKRHRDKGDELSFEDFVLSEEKENKPDAKPFEQNIGHVAHGADAVVLNEGQLDEMRENLKGFLRNRGLYKN
jgi:dephospho-CoA kinase